MLSLSTYFLFSSSDVEDYISLSKQIFYLSTVLIKHPLVCFTFHISFYFDAAIRVQSQDLFRAIKIHILKRSLLSSLHGEEERLCFPFQIPRTLIKTRVQFSIEVARVDLWRLERESGRFTSIDLHRQQKAVVKVVLSRIDKCGGARETKESLGRQWKEVSKGNLNPDVCRETCLYSVEHGILLIVDRCLTLFDNPLVHSLHTTYNELKLKNGCVWHSKSMSQRRQAVRTTKPHRRRWSPGRFGT
ncbi:hypothetical protein AtNW77_Chr5g0120621 [Arabidopsis thaliana]